MQKFQDRAGTTPRSHRYPRRWAVLFLGFYLGGLMLFHVAADFNVPAWASAYYVWQFAKDALAIVAICSFSARLWAIFLPFIYYSVLRLALELVAWCTGIDVNNPVIVMTLFLVALFVCIFLVLNDTSQWKQLFKKDE